MRETHLYPLFTRNEYVVMHRFYAVQSIWYLIYSIAVFTVLVLSHLMVSQARRKRRTTLLGWPYLACIGATFQAASCVISDAFLLGVREQFPIFTFQCLLGAIACLAMAFSAIRLWAIIKALPEAPRVGLSESSQRSEPEGTWPPPPKVMR